MGNSTESENFNLVAEQEARGKTMETLRSTQGWTALTDRQQRLIQEALYIQARADRAFAKSDPTLPTSNRGEKYTASNMHIVKWYCHAAIYDLEREQVSDYATRKIPAEFFKTEYHEAENIQKVEQMIEACGYPCIIFISAVPHNSEESSMLHTCLALGKNGEGGVTVFEKRAFNLPYQITTLNQVYENYKGSQPFWGMRKLKNTGEYEKKPE